MCALVCKPRDKIDVLLRDQGKKPNLQICN